MRRRPRRARKKKKRVSKRENQRKHAIRRAYERFGLELNGADLNSMTRMIRKGESECISKTSCNFSVHALEFKGHRMRVVYDKKRKTPVTVMRMEFLS